MKPIDNTKVLSWFSGKALKNAAAALRLIEDSLTQEYWVPGARRKAVAALNKTIVSQRIAKEHEASLSHSAYMIMMFGLEQIDRQERVQPDVDARTKQSIEVAVREERLRSKVKDYIADFRPVLEAIAHLDAHIPPPVITVLGASPTITATLKDIGLDVNVATIRVCPIKWVKVERIDPKTGRKTYVQLGFLEFPPNTVHNASRYDWTDNNRQCQACGHAIRRATNWVPILIDNAAGVPHLLWVGKDCADTLFGVKVKGDLELGDPAIWGAT